MDPAPLLGSLSVFCTLLMFGTGLSDLRKMVSTKSVDNIQYLPFLTMNVNNLAWLHYGCLVRDWALVTVNTIGAALQSLYILVYLCYSPAKRPVLLRLLLVLVCLAIVWRGFWDVDEENYWQVGCTYSVFTIIMYLSPLADLAKIIKSKSTRCLSYPLTVTSLLASTSWTCYGLVQRDPYITVPNVPGIVSSVIRVWLFCRYPPGQDKTLPAPGHLSKP